MLTNYFKLAYRNLLKNKASSIINIVGLSIAISCSIVVYLFMQLHLSMDAFHENADTIFLVGNIVERNGNQHISDRAPMPLGAALATDFPQIDRAVRIESGGQATIQHHDEVFNERVWFAEDGFFDLFTFPLTYGDPSALADKDAIILSAQAAQRYFGEEQALGKELSITFNQDYPRTFVVRGVAEPLPDNASFRFNLLVNFAVGEEVGGDAVDSWRGNTLATFIQVKHPDDLPGIAGQMEPYRALQNAANDSWPIKTFTFTNLLDVSGNAHQSSVSISQGTNPATLVVFPIIALFLLALSSFNYMNIAMSQATRRLKEIGVRKVMGSHKYQLVIQFLGENILLCLLALVVGTWSTSVFLLPAFNALFQDAAPLTLSLMDNMGLWGFFLVLLLLTGMAAGAYPAFYIASFKPVAIFQGKKQVLGGRRWFTRSFLTLQFVLAFITMVTSLVFYQNATYQAERDWGYNEAQTLVVRLSHDGQYNILADELRRHPSVLSVAGSIHHIMPRGSGPGGVIEVPGAQVESRRYDVSPNYLETMGLRLQAGRFFDPAQTTDAAEALVINEAFARGLDWSATDAIGQRIPWDESTTYTVVGVVEDFHGNDFSMPIEPALFRIVDADRFQHMVLRVQASTGNQTEALVSATWSKLFPGELYDTFFQDTVFDRFYRENKNITQVFAFAALMALFISCMGLFGLASQNIIHRMKEVSIRKMLGASAPHIVQKVNRGFLFLLVVAGLIAMPISYFMLDALLASMYEYHMALDVTPFLLAFVIVLFTSLLTITFQIHKVIRANPADVLRNA